MLDELWFGKYRIVRLLGEGATSKVYLAFHERMQQYRAIKCFPKNIQSYEQVKQEANLLLRLNSPAIPIIYDLEEDDMNLCIIEEYVEGESLLSYRNRVGRLPESELLKLSLQICELIHYLHSFQIPILYLDLKPSNLILKEQQVKLIDFGSARFKSTQSYSKNYGTKGFAAPEQYIDGSLEETTDVYGIGMLMYYLMTGTTDLSKHGGKRDVMLAEYSKQFVKLMFQAVKHNSCERYDSVQSLERRLRKLSRKKETTTAHSSKTIALIGGQRKVGVTHLAFYILSQLTYSGLKTIYVECTNSNVVTELVSCCKDKDETFIRYRNCILTRQEWMDFKELQEYDYVIYDCGAIDHDVMELFQSADIKVAVLGGQIWEMKRSIALIKQLQKIKGIKYIVNHLSAQEFHYRVRKFKGLNARRMPQECDAFRKSQVLIKELVQSIIE